MGTFFNDKDLNLIISSLNNLILIFSIFLFLIELISLFFFSDILIKEDRRENYFYWGDKNTFIDLSNKDQTIIGPGGRLRPNLNVKIFNPFKKNGVQLKTNSIGFRNNTDFNQKNIECDLRILNLGDSFSIGFQQDQSTFFGAKLQSLLSDSIKRDSIEVLNVEISDPVNAAIYLENYIKNWKPDIVLFGIFSSDIIQAESLKGSDKLFKFDNNGNLRPNNDFDSTLGSFFSRYSELKYHKPFLKKSTRISEVKINLKNRMERFTLTRNIIYFLSRFFKQKDNILLYSYSSKYEKKDGFKRFFDGSSNIGFLYKDKQNKISAIYKPFFDVISYINNICEINGSKFILMNHPMRYQVQNKDWEIISERWNLDVNDFDLNYHNRRLNNFCLKNNIYFIDPIENFRKNNGQLYQPNDSHYNEAGHFLAAKITAHKIIDFIK